MKNIKSVLTAIIFTLTGLTAICSCSGDNKRPGEDWPEMKMPYVALNMALGTQIIITKDKEYLQELEERSGMSRKTIWELFGYLQENRTRTKVTANARDEISKSLAELQELPDDGKLKFFVVNILAPYLTMVVNSFDISDAVGEEIQSIFAELFGVPQDQENPLLELVEGTWRYNNGGVFKVSYIYGVNEYLKKQGLCLDYNPRGTNSTIFKIEYMICEDKEWRPDEKISILVLKRIYPNILDSKLGYAPAGHSSVFIIKDLHYNNAKKLKNEFKKRMPHMPYTDQDYTKLWSSLGLDMDLVRANRMRYNLTHRDLYGSSLSQIEKNFILETAIHEAKHRIDEIEMPEMRLNIDLEVSAYLTTAIVGIYPFHELRKAIEWTEVYYRSTGSAKLKNLLKELWVLAEKSLKQDYTEEALRADMLNIYEKYRTVMGNVNYINLNEFKQRMVPIILKGKE